MQQDHEPFVRPRRAGRRTAGALAVGAALLLSACASSATSPTGSATAPSTIRFASSTATPQDSFDPTRQLSNFEIMAVGQVYDSLLTLDNKFQPHAGVLTAWEPADEGRRWTLTVKDGLTFHDGSPVTAKDVKYSIARNLDPKTSSPVVGLLSPYLSADAISVVDEHTVELRLTSPYAFLPVVLGNRYMRVIKDGTVDFAKPVGTGPYKLVQHKPGQTLELARNETYWRAKPTATSVVSRNIPDSSSRLQALLGGEVDAVESIEYSQVPTVEKSAAHELAILEEAYIPTVDLDLTVKPFDDPRVVSAIKLTIDREQLVKTVFHGMASVAADTPVAPSDPFFSAELASPKRDVAQAKKLLAEAGYPDGFTHEFMVSEVGPSVGQFGVALSQQLAEAGIDFKIRQTPPSTYWDNVWKKASASTPFYFRRPADEMLTYIATTKGGFNGTKWSNKAFDDAVVKARATLDPKEQSDLYAQAERIHSTEGGNLMPVFTHAVSAGSKGLTDFGPSPINLLTFAAKS